MEFEEIQSQDGLDVRSVLKLENENLHKTSLPRSCHVNFKHTNRSCEGRYPGRTRSRKLPSCTTDWDIIDLDSVGVYYKDKPDTISTLLDMVYSQTEMFRGLTSEQSEFVKTLENCFTFSFDISDLLVYSSQKLDMLLVDSIKEDVTESGSHGAMFKSTMNILQKSVTAEPDVVILAGNILENPRAVCAVSVAEIQFVDKSMSYCHHGHARFKKTRQKEPEPSSSSSAASISSLSSSSADSEQSDYDEKTVHGKPHIFKRIPPKLLAQHGGQLLVLSQLYTGQHFTKDKTQKLIPGIIVMETQVTFTLLEYSVNHMKDLFLNNVNGKERSYIYYTEPMDYLKQEDRNLLLKSIVRLSNVKQ